MAEFDLSILIPYLFGPLTFWPFRMMLKRAGLSPLWALLAFVPYMGLILIASVLAFKPWPNMNIPERKDNNG